MKYFTISLARVTIALVLLLLITPSQGQINSTVIGRGAFGTHYGANRDYSVHIGYQAGLSGSAGSGHNVYIGVQSGYSQTRAMNNSFVGYRSGYFNTTGLNNSFFGFKSGFSNTSGSDNAFFGLQSGFSNTSGRDNAFFGFLSGFNNTEGRNNTYLGYKTAYKNKEGVSNTMVGFQAGYLGAGGSKNTFLGANAGYKNAGVENIFIGYQAGYDEIGSHKLYIDNTATSSPLIWGDFSANQIKVNGTFHSTGILKSDGAIQIDGKTVIDDNAGWHRSYGGTGWYNNTYGGGIYMVDDTWIRTYGSKSFYHDAGTMRTDGIFQVGPNGNRFLVDGEGSVVAFGNIFGRSANNSYSNLYRFGGIYFTWDSYSYGTNTHHSIRSTYGDAYGDHLTMNSFGHIRFNFDSNNNGTNVFQIGHATTGSGNVLFHLKETGELGLGTTSPAEKLHVNGSIRGNLEGGAIRIQSVYGHTDVGAQDASWSHFDTDMPRFYFNRGISVDEGLIGSYNEDLQLQTSGVTAITVSNTNQDVTLANNLIVGGTLKLDRTGNNIPPDDNVEDLMVLKTDGTIAFRDVRSIESPWLLDSLGAGLINIGCDPSVLGDCEINVFDLNGNLRIGDNSVLDDDMDYGGLGDDWMKFSGYIELSTSTNAGDKGLILLDRTSNLNYLNLFQNGDISYFANSQNATEDRYFLKSHGRDVEFGRQVTAPKLAVTNEVRFNLSSNNASEEVLVTGPDGIVHKRVINSFSPWSLNADNSYSTPNRLGIGDSSPDENSTLSVSSASQVGLYVRNTNTNSTAYGLRSEVSGANVKAIAAVDASSGHDVFRVYGNGIVEAKEVLVSIDIWNDHVFYPTYDLMPLEQVEAYVKENHHLPEIPSEKEVMENGVNLGEMEALLLKKVEELTLYIIDQNKQLKEQSHLLKRQAEQIEKLERKLN